MSVGKGWHCAVALCTSSYKHREIDSNNKISFHRFPKNPAIRKKWVSLCKRSDEFNAETHVICSEHFKPEDFIRDLQAELLGYKPRRKLAPGTVPTQKIPYEPEEPKSVSALRRRKKMEMKRKALAHKELIRAALETPAPPPVPVNQQVQKDCLNFNVPVPDYRLLYEKLCTQTSSLEEQLEIQTKKLKVSNAQNKQLTRQIMHRDLRWISKAKAKRAAKDEVKKVLEKRFTANEIKILTEKRQKVHWTREEISKAINLLCLSRRAYLYVRKTLRFPLPGISSLQNRAKTMHQSSGLLADFRVDNPRIEREDIIDCDTLSSSCSASSPASETSCPVEITVESLIFENEPCSELKGSDNPKTKN